MYRPPQWEHSHVKRSGILVGKLELKSWRRSTNNVRVDQAWKYIILGFLISLSATLKVTFKFMAKIVMFSPDVHSEWDRNLWSTTLEMNILYRFIEKYRYSPAPGHNTSYTMMTYTPMTYHPRLFLLQYLHFLQMPLSFLVSFHFMFKPFILLF